MALKFKTFRNMDFDAQYKFFQESGYDAELKERAELSRKLNVDAVPRKPDKLFNAGHFYREISTEDYEAIEAFHQKWSLTNAPIEVLREFELARSLNLFTYFKSITREFPFGHGFLIGMVEDKKYLIAHWGEKLIQIEAWRLHREKMQKLEAEEERNARSIVLGIMASLPCLGFALLRTRDNLQNPPFDILFIVMGILIMLFMGCHKQSEYDEEKRKLNKSLPEESYEPLTTLD